jgi:hypothetical protein
MRQLFLLLVGFTFGWAAGGAELQFDFGSVAPGSPLPKFHSGLLGGGGPVKWEILPVEAPSAFTPLTDRAQNVARRSVLAQTSQDPTDERFPMFIYDGDKFRDFKLTTRFKIVSGVAEQMAGVVFRFQNESNFYVVRVSALGKNVRFYKVVNGLRSNPLGPACDVAPGTWHQLGVQCAGNQITIWLDGLLVLPPLGDNTFAEGKVGFWTKSDSVSYFSDASMDYIPIMPAAQTLVNTVMDQQPRILGLRIYTLGTNGVASVLASKDPAEIGMAGTEAEMAAIKTGTISFGRDHGTVLVTLPFPDRNGEYMAAVRFKLRSFLGETQDNAVNRATTLLKLMETLCTSSEDLLK